MNKKILNLLIISSCAMFSVAANYDELSRFGLQKDKTNTPKHLPTKPPMPSTTPVIEENLKAPESYKQERKKIEPATTLLMPSTTPEIGTTLKAPEFSEQQIQKLDAILNGQTLPSQRTQAFAGAGFFLYSMSIGQLITGSPEGNLIFPMAIAVECAVGVGCLLKGYVSYQQDIEKAKNCRKDLIEKTKEINKFYEENSKNSN